MMFQFKLPDETFEIYVKKFGVPGCYAAMKQAVEAYKDVDREDRVLLISGDTRRALEAVFQTTIDDGAKLVRLTQNLNSVRIQDVNMQFSSDQLERLQAQAGFYGRTLEQYVREQVKEIAETMLERV
jgi:hypothetical protein